MGLHFGNCWYEVDSILIDATPHIIFIAMTVMEVKVSIQMNI